MKKPRFVTLDQLIDEILTTPHQGMSIEQIARYSREREKLETQSECYPDKVRALDLTFSSCPMLNELFRRGVFSVDPYNRRRNAILRRALNAS